MVGVLVDYAIPAALVSITALTALRWAQQAPSRIRFGLAFAGLAAWFVPWPKLSLSFTRADTLPALPWLGETAGQWTSLKQGIAQSLDVASAPVPGFGYWWMLIFLPGIVWISIELRQHRATVLSWQRRSVCRDSLRSYLPDGLRATGAEVRVVAGSSAAAATGIRRQRIFLGDALLEDGNLSVALVHEAMHLKRCDPVRVFLVTFMARLFWFNPFAAGLRRAAMLAIESGCDEACVSLLGREAYRGSLARQMLDRQTPTSFHLAPALYSGSMNLARLRLLGRAPETGARVWAAFAAMTAAGLTGAAFAANVAADIRIGDWVEVTDASRYGYDISPVSRRYEALGRGMVRLSGDLLGQGSVTQRADLRCDGQDYPVQRSTGSEGNLLVACDRIDRWTTRYVTRSVDGANTAVRSVSTETVAPDGRSLTMNDSIVIGEQTIESSHQFSRID